MPLCVPHTTAGGPANEARQGIVSRWWEPPRGFDSELVRRVRWADVPVMLFSRKFISLFLQCFDKTNRHNKAQQRRALNR